MKYVVKFLSLAGLALAVVYTFFINGDVSQYGFWLWTLDISALLLTLANIAGLVMAFASAHDKCYDDEKGLLIASSFIGFLVYSGIFYFSVAQENPDWTYLACCFLVYMLSSGFNSRTWSFVFLGLTQYIFFCEDFFVMNTWHSWAIYAFLTIIHVTVIFFVIADRMDTGNVPPIELVGLLIPVTIFVYTLCVNSGTLQIEMNTFLILCCLIFSLLSSIRDSTNMFVGISIVTIIYLLATPCSIGSYLLVFIGICCLLAGIVHTMRKVILISLLSDATDNNMKLISKYKDLVSEYNNLVSDYNGLVSNYGQRGGHTGNSGGYNSFKNGVIAGAGKVVVDVTIDVLKWIAGA